MKTYSESKFEMRNLQILKKMPEKQGQFLSSEQPCELNSLDVALKITGAEKYPRKVKQKKTEIRRLWRPSEKFVRQNHFYTRTK